jgi:hypothetical protein
MSNINMTSVMDIVVTWHVWYICAWTTVKLTKYLCYPRIVGLKFPPRRRGQAQVSIKTWNHLTLNKAVILVVETYTHSHVTHAPVILVSYRVDVLVGCAPCGWLSTIYRTWGHICAKIRMSLTGSPQIAKRSSYIATCFCLHSFFDDVCIRQQPASL